MTLNMAFSKEEVLFAISGCVCIIVIKFSFTMTKHLRKTIHKTRAAHDIYFKK